MRETDLGSFAVQIELVLTNGHGPDGLAESRRGGEPNVNIDVRRTKRPAAAFATWKMVQSIGQTHLNQKF